MKKLIIVLIAIILLGCNNVPDVDTRVEMENNNKIKILEEQIKESNNQIKILLKKIESFELNIKMTQIENITKKDKVEKLENQNNFYINSNDRKREKQSKDTEIKDLNNKIDDLSKKIEKLEYKEENNFTSTYSVDQIYKNSMQYYNRTISHVKWLIGIIGSLLGGIVVWFKVEGDKKLKEERKEIREDAKDLKKEIRGDVKGLNKEIKMIVKEKNETTKNEVDKGMERMWDENKELKEKIEKQEENIDRKTLKLDEKIVKQEEELERKILELDKKIEESEINIEIVDINNRESKEEKEFLYKNLIGKYPKNSSVYIHYGNYNHTNKDNTKAIENYKKALELDPENCNAYFNMGLSYEKSVDDYVYEDPNENYAKSKENYTKALGSYGEAKTLDKENKWVDEKIRGVKDKLEKLVKPS